MSRRVPTSGLRPFPLGRAAPGQEDQRRGPIGRDGRGSGFVRATGEGSGPVTATSVRTILREWRAWCVLLLLVRRATVTSWFGGFCGESDGGPAAGGDLNRFEGIARCFRAVVRGGRVRQGFCR